MLHRIEGPLGSLQFAECNGAPCMNASSRWYNQFTARLFHWNVFRRIFRCRFRRDAVVRMLRHTDVFTLENPPTGSLKIAAWIPRIKNAMSNYKFGFRFHMVQNAIRLSTSDACPVLYHTGYPLDTKKEPIHYSRVVQEWLSLQADFDLPPWTPDMNTIENIWSEVKRTMQETWPGLSPRNSDELWTLVSDAWDEVASSGLSFDHWLSLWHEEWNQRLKHSGSRLLIKEASFCQQPL